MRFYTGRKNFINKKGLFYAKFSEFEEFSIVPFFCSSIQPQHTVVRLLGSSDTRHFYHQRLPQCQFCKVYVKATKTICQPFFGLELQFLRDYFLPSLNFPALPFKREGAKEASFFEVKLFTRRHISKWVRK
jgi:hypothetical protein